MDALDKIKQTGTRFNKEVIETWNEESFNELMDKDFINHTAVPGTDNGPEGMRNSFNNILRPAFPDLKVTIHQQVAEGDLLTTRKSLSGTHLGTFLGVPPTGQKVTINVIDMVRIKDGKYLEHWGMNSMMAVAAQLRERAKA